MIFLLDNYDSFTENLVHLVAALGQEPWVKQHDQITVDEVFARQPQAIVLCAGPKTPFEAGITLDLIRLALGRVPLLGICLGHQALGVAAGAGLTSAKTLIHGRAVPLYHQSQSLFAGLPNPLMGARYNSLVLDACPPGYRVLAHDDEGQIMAMQHVEHPAWGLQFHPESFMTKCGDQLLQAFFHAAFALHA